MIDAADHTGIVGRLMAAHRVRTRWQSADADDVEGEMSLALVRAAASHDPTLGAFSSHAYACLQPLAAAGCRDHARFRRRTFRRRGRERTVRAVLFADLGGWFRLRSHLLATQPPAEAALEAAEEVTAMRDRLDRLLAETLGESAIKTAVLRERFGIGCEPQTLHDVSRKLGVTRERVRQIQLNALRVIRHAITPTVPDA